jgi:DNA polymerase-3 subunit gamma/tau
MAEFNIKYRPQKIEELDLASIREGLEKVLTSKEIPHALLFCGPRGTGKTSAARIVAKAVNCIGRAEDRSSFAQASQAKNFEPCNKCEQCLSITSGTNLDVLEIDAASNRGIDDIRDLREKIKLSPIKAKYKVYIIDEVHMLTLEAFNALLKTLEEPPQHAIFILCTTDPEKLPETILSRCMRFNFKRASKAEIVNKLKKICQTENIDAEESALEAIAKVSAGSFRDAQKILEQASFAAVKITLEEVGKTLGRTVGLKPERLLKLMTGKDIKEALLEISRVVESGANLKVYLQDLLELLRIGLLSLVGVEEEKAELDEETKEVISSYKIGEIQKLIVLFSRAASELKDAVIPQLPLELAIVAWFNDSRQNEEGKNNDDKEDGKDEGTIDDITDTDTKQQSDEEGSDAASLEEVKNRWHDILLGVRPKNHSVEALLRATRPLEFSGSTLTLEVFYQFHKDQLETEKCRRIVEETASLVIGKPIRLKCVLGEKPVKKVLEGQNENLPGEVSEEDLIKVAEEIFSGRVN